MLYFDIYTLNLGAFSRKHMLMSTTQKSPNFIRTEDRHQIT